MVSVVLSRPMTMKQGMSEIERAPFARLVFLQCVLFLFLWLFGHVCLLSFFFNKQVAEPLSWDWTLHPACVLLQDHAASGLREERNSHSISPSLVCQIVLCIPVTRDVTGTRHTHKHLDLMVHGH